MITTTKNAPLIPITQEMGVLETISGTGDEDQIYIFYYIATSQKPSTSMVGLIREGFSLRSFGLSGFIREIAIGLNSKSLQQEASLSCWERSLAGLV